MTCTARSGRRPRAAGRWWVFFYGGSWRSGKRADHRFVGQALASHGMLVRVADDRLYPEVPLILQDAAAAVTHALEQAVHRGGNVCRVFVMVHSAGAYNAAMVSLDPRWLAEAAQRVRLRDDTAPRNQGSSAGGPASTWVVLVQHLRRPTPPPQPGQPAQPLRRP